MKTAARILRFPYPMIFSLALGFWSIGSHGQEDLGSDVAPQGGEISKGKPSDPHKMKFKFVDEEEEKKQAAQKKASKDQQDQAEASDFKTYVGYPKHQFGAHLEPKRIAAAFTYANSTYNFNTNALAYGLDYNFVITPRLTIGVDYTHYSVKMDAGTTSGLNFNSSSANFDDYFAKVRYCFISDLNFERRFCPGIDIGNDSYPVLQFTGANNLEITNMSDFIIGANATGIWPIKALFLLKGIAGVNIGTGSGSSGSTTSKGDYSYYFDLITDWKLGHNADFQQGVQVGMGIKMRDAKIAGTTNSKDVSWEDKVIDEMAYLGYTIMF